MTENTMGRQGKTVFGVIEVTSYPFESLAAEIMAQKHIRHTITFSYYLSYSVQTLLVISNLKLHTDIENNNGTKCLEALNVTPSTDVACNNNPWLIP